MKSPGRIRSILFATDFSDCAGVALAWAIAIARAHDAAILIVHGIAPPPRTSIALDLQYAAERGLAGVAEQVRAAGVRAETTFDSGQPWDVVTRAEKESGADLIVIGSRGHTPAGHLMLGRVADRVIRTARGPVLTVHPGDDAAPIRISTVLTGIDFSRESVMAAEAAASLLRTSAEPRRLLLLHACHEPIEYAVSEVTGVVAGDVAVIEPPETVGPRLEEVARRLRADDLSVETVTSEGYATSAIEAIAIDRGVDIIAMGTSGRAGLSRMLLGSIAERTLHHAPCPVLTVGRQKSALASAGAEITPGTTLATG